MHEATLLRESDAGGFVAALKRCTADMHDRDALMTTAFQGIGSMPGARLERMRAAASTEVEAERASLAARRAARAGTS